MAKKETKEHVYYETKVYQDTRGIRVLHRIPVKGDLPATVGAFAVQHEIILDLPTGQALKRIATVNALDAKSIEDAFDVAESLLTAEADRLAQEIQSQLMKQVLSSGALPEKKLIVPG